LLRGGPLSKDAVSRLVGRLKSDFEAWRSRDLVGAEIPYLLADGWYPKVRLGKRLFYGVPVQFATVVIDYTTVPPDTDPHVTVWWEVVTEDARITGSAEQQFAGLDLPEGHNREMQGFHVEGPIQSTGKRFACSPGKARRVSRRRPRAPTRRRPRGASRPRSSSRAPWHLLNR
jgi:hypothetical protein